MTRFARARGSKASNERREEEATPWHVMRQQLEEQLNSHAAKSQVDKSYNLKEILHNGDNLQKEVVWNDFGEMKSNILNQNESKKVKSVNVERVIPGSKKNISETFKDFNSDGAESNINLKHLNTEDISSEQVFLKKIKNEIKNNLSFKDNLVLDNLTKVNNKSISRNNFSVDIVESSRNGGVKRRMKDDLSKHNMKNKPDNCNKETDSNYPIKVKKKKNGKLKIKNNSEEPSRGSSFTNLSERDEPQTSLIVARSPEKKKNSQSVNKGISKDSEIKDNKTEEFLMPNESCHGLYESSCIEEKPPKILKSSQQKNKNIPDVSGSFNHHNNSGKYGYHENYYGKNNDYFSYASDKRYQTIIANGREIHIVKYQGFFIKKEDADELKKLRKKLLAQNVTKEKLDTIMKLERRKAEKALAREKKKVCFHCRQFGHNFSDCPDIKDSDKVKTGVCFKCGSLEHSHFDCKVMKNQEYRHAVCFVCKEQGHIARQCPLNSQGLYPKGGSCHLCGEVTHLRKDCPKAVEEKSSKSVTVDILKDGAVEDLSGKSVQVKQNEGKKKKVIQFK